MTLSEMRSSMLANFLTVNNSIIENADVWERGNTGHELSPTEMEIYKRLVLNVNDNFFHTFQTARLLELDWQEQVLSQFAGFLWEHPKAHQVWLEREQKLNFYQTTIDPTETITSEWIDGIESRIVILENKLKSQE